MPKYTASYTVVKSFKGQVVFEAPNEEAAAEMASEANCTSMREWISNNSSSMVSSSSSYRIEPANEDSVTGLYSQYGRKREELV